MQSNTSTAAISSLDLTLVINDFNVLEYLAQFDGETRIEKANEAIRVGVIAIQSASPSLDTSIVQSQFSDMESKMRKSIDEFKHQFKNELEEYFENEDGLVPRKLDNVFGDGGLLPRTFANFFDPDEGRLSRLIQAHVGPDSDFGKSLNPDNKKGVVAVLEARVQELVEAKLDEVLKEFSLDEDGSAMSRLQKLLSESFTKINRAMGHLEGEEKEARRGHVKGMKFEKELYDHHFADMCLGLDDEPAFVARTPGQVDDCKTGDFVSSLGDTTGAPGVNLTVEVKDGAGIKLKDARNELQEAKVNRNAGIGVFVWSQGNEPTEVGDFRRIGDDFYVTVNREDLRDGKPLVYLEAAYKIARAMAVATVRSESEDGVDLAKIQSHVESIGTWSEKIADMATKAKTIKRNGRIVEECANDLKQDLDQRLAEILSALKA